MPPDINPDHIAGLLLQAFNEGSAAAITELCHPSVRINSAILTAAPRSGGPMNDPLTALTTACRLQFPGIAFSNEHSKLTSSAHGNAFSFEGSYRCSQSSDRVVIVPCTCRFRVENGKVTQIWFSIDHYSVLLQLNRVLSEPGHAADHSDALNQRIVDGLAREILQRKTASETLAQEVITHARLEIYKDIGAGLTETERLHLDGAGKVNEVLSFVRRFFADPLELALGTALCQGHTSTFRGKIRAKFGTGLRRYNIVISVSSPGGRVTDCWIRIVPPPTLMECLL